MKKNTVNTKEVKVTVNDYQQAFKLSVLTYTDTKKQARIEELKKRLNQEGDKKGLKFSPLKKESFDSNDGNEYRRYREALEEYQKALYIGKSYKAKDSRLVTLLCLLSVPVTDIQALKKADIHTALSKSVMTDGQVMTEEGKALAKLYRGQLKTVTETGKYNGRVLSETALAEKIADLNKKIDDIKNGPYWEQATLKQISLTKFQAIFEKFIADALSNGIGNIITKYVTASERTENNRWRKLKKRSQDLNIAEDTYKEYFNRNDHKGFKSFMDDMEKEKAEKKTA